MQSTAPVLESGPPPLVGSGLFDPLDAFVLNTPTMPGDTATALAGSAASASASLVCRDDLHLEPGCVVRDDMTPFDFDAFTIVGRGAVLRPPLHTFIHHNTAQCEPVVKVGAFTVIGANTVSEASEIGHFVRIDDGCVIGRGVVVPNGVWLQTQTVVMPDAKLAPFTVYGGCPATACGQLDVDAFQLLQMEYVRHRLQSVAQ